VALVSTRVQDQPIDLKPSFGYQPIQNNVVVIPDPKIKPIVFPSSGAS
jgi:hypothetical protein